MNPLWREYAIMWHSLRLRWWRWAEANIHPCHTDLPLILRKQWEITKTIRELEAQRG